MSSSLQPVALFLLPDAQSSAAALTREIRASSYLAEVFSDGDGDGDGDESGQQSALASLVRPVELSELSSVEDCVRYLCSSSSEDYAKSVLVVADKEESLLVVQLDAGANAGEEKDRMRIVPRSLLEVAVNLQKGSMSIADYKAMCGNAPVFDAGQ